MAEIYLIIYGESIDIKVFLGDGKLIKQLAKTLRIERIVMSLNI